MEQYVFKDAEHGRAGLLDALSLPDYHIPTSLEMRDLDALIVESIDSEGLCGAKEAGEGPLHLSIPAIPNAICDTIGDRTDRLPFTAPNVWRGILAVREPGTLGRPQAISDETAGVR